MKNTNYFNDWKKKKTEKFDKDGKLNLMIKIEIKNKEDKNEKQ